MGSRRSARAEPCCGHSGRDQLSGAVDSSGSGAQHVRMATLPGMILGQARRSWAAEHHGGWLRDQEHGGPEWLDEDSAVETDPGSVPHNLRSDPPPTSPGVVEDLEPEVLPPSCSQTTPQAWASVSTIRSPRPPRRRGEGSWGTGLPVPKSATCTRIVWPAWVQSSTIGPAPWYTALVTSSVTSSRDLAGFRIHATAGVRDALASLRGRGHRGRQTPTRLAERTGSRPRHTGPPLQDYSHGHGVKKWLPARSRPGLRQQGSRVRAAAGPGQVAGRGSSVWLP